MHSRCQLCNTEVINSQSNFSDDEIPALQDSPVDLGAPSLQLDPKNKKPW